MFFKYRRWPAVRQSVLARAPSFRQYAAMLSKMRTCAVVGLDGSIVEVEVDMSRGLPAFFVVGLPGAAVQEARERVRATIRNSGCNFPMMRTSANLVPAGLRKEEPAYDLPIAVGVVIASRQAPQGLEDTLLLGEMSMDFFEVVHTQRSIRHFKPDPVPEPML